MGGVDFKENSQRMNNIMVDSKNICSNTSFVANGHNNNHNNNNGKKKSHSNRKYSSKKSSKSSSSSSSSSSSGAPSQSDSKDRSKDAGHYEFKAGTKLYSKQNKYKIISHISDGTFGRVLECKNYSDDKHYAVKVIRAVDRYIDSAKTETEIIEKI